MYPFSSVERNLRIVESIHPEKWSQWKEAPIKEFSEFFTHHASYQRFWQLEYDVQYAKSATFQKSFETILVGNI